MRSLYDDPPDIMRVADTELTGYRQRLNANAEIRCQSFISPAAVEHILQLDEISDLQIEIVHDRSEAPSNARVTIIADNLLDDAIRSFNARLVFSQDEELCWKIDSAESAWRCQRENSLNKFSTTQCH